MRYTYKTVAAGTPTTTKSPKSRRSIIGFLPYAGCLSEAGSLQYSQAACIV
jgi:hypothetical protein